MPDLLKRALVSTGLLTAGLAFFYFELLDANAREQLKKAIFSLRESYAAVSEVFANQEGVVDEDDLPNRDEALRQWAKLGF